MRRNILFALMGCMAVVSMAAAQPPDTLWTRTFGGIEEDYGRSVQQTTDGGYIISGGTCSYGAGVYDVYLIKTDASGTEQWCQAFGGSFYDYGYSVQQTGDGGYIIAGITGSFGAGGYDVYLIKTNASGDTLWTKTFGGSEFDCGYSVDQTSDGGYIIAGYTWSYGSGLSDVYLIKTDASGNQEWNQTFGGRGWDEGWSVQQTGDGGYIVAGYTSSYGAGLSDIYLIKTDASGIEQWSQTFGGSYNDRGYSVQQTGDGGYIIAGITPPTIACIYDIRLIKTDSSGIEQWSQTFGGSDYDWGWSVQQTSDGGYIMAGTTKSYGVGYYDVYLIKTDESGIEQWNQTFGGNEYDCGYSVDQTSDGGYIIAGYGESIGAGGSDVLLIRLASEVGVKPQNPNQAYEFQLIPAYPNPFNPTTTIRFALPTASWVKLEVFDISGRLVGARHASPLLDRFLEAGTHEVCFDGSNLTSGIYIYQLKAKEFKASNKMILMK